MKRSTRIMIFYLLLGTFAASAPIVVAYSLGYAIDVFKQEVRENGGVFLKSKTTRVSVMLDEKLIKETSGFYGSALITDITPGPHMLKLIKENRQPWSKTILVEPLKVIESRNIFLLPEKIDIATSSELELPPAPSQNVQVSFKLNKRGDLIKIQNASSTVIATDVHSFKSFDEEVYLVTQKGFLASFKINEGTLNTLGYPGFYISKKPFGFFRSPAAEILILDSAGGTLLLDPSDNLIPLEGAVLDVKFDEKGKKALLVKENTIGLIWLDDNQQGPFQKRLTKEAVINSTALIRDAEWFYQDNAHFIFSTDEGVFFTEIDGLGGRNTTQIVEGKTDEIITSASTPNTIFLKKGKTFYKIEL